MSDEHASTEAERAIRSEILDSTTTTLCRYERSEHSTEPIVLMQLRKGCSIPTSKHSLGLATSSNMTPWELTAKELFSGLFGQDTVGYPNGNSEV